MYTINSIAFWIKRNSEKDFKLVTNESKASEASIVSSMYNDKKQVVFIQQLGPESV